MSTVHSFLEESAWDRNNERRKFVRQVSFRLELGELSETFVGDYGVFYDPEDQYLIELLSRQFSGVNWDTFVFWKNQLRAEITLIDPMTESEVGKITVRRAKSDPSGEIDWTNVVSMTANGFHFREAAQG